MIDITIIWGTNLLKACATKRPSFNNSNEREKERAANNIMEKKSWIWDESHVSYLGIINRDKQEWRN